MAKHEACKKELVASETVRVVDLPRRNTAAALLVT